MADTKSEFSYFSELDVNGYVDKVVKCVNRLIDEDALKKVEDQLAEYGYVKVVRCRDCRFRCYNECTRIDEGFKDYWFAIEPDGFCAWADKAVKR